ncbi:ileal sodium/bile acid cotransporter-like isoform X3 [Mytilus californianus]|uniref:ileal sodium/bile acid cotransporter-like isoform X3 n=1 Tax=Mytilus californianus TaxID=6549 RepID=UPI002246FC7A|nr:ileal sodium/bile acid cotransporter-like isoform X3 [Mytilus californianus]
MDISSKIILLHHMLITLSLSLAASDMSKGDPMAPPDMINASGILSVKGPPPHGVVIVFMEEDSAPQYFNYTVQCGDETLKYVIRAKADDAKMVNVKTNDVIIDCRNRRLVLMPLVSLTNGSVVGPSYSVGDKVQKQKENYFVQGTHTLYTNSDLLGRTFITFNLYSYNDLELQHNITEDMVDVTKVPVIILRLMRPIDTAFRVIIYVFMIFVTLAFGAKLDLEVVKENIKRPLAPCIGLGCQFIIMPMLGYAIAKLVTADRPDVALGIFVAACCPGGGASNIYSYLLGGDLSLSITMTALSSIMALGMMPMWLYTLGQQFIDGTLQVPFLDIFTTLLILIVPLFVGVFLQKKLPKITKVIIKVIRPVTVVCIILLLSVGIYSNLYIFKLFKPKIVLAGCLLPYFGYLLGGLISFIFRLPWERVKTVAIETGMQNTGIATILMMYAFPPPDGFIAAVAPIASAVMTPLPLFLITVPYLIYKRCNKDKYDSVPNENGSIKKKKPKSKKDSKETTLDVENGKTTVI